MFKKFSSGALVDLTSIDALVVSRQATMQDANYQIEAMVSNNVSYSTVVLMKGLGSEEVAVREIARIVKENKLKLDIYPSGNAVSSWCITGVKMLKAGTKYYYQADIGGFNLVTLGVMGEGDIDAVESEIMGLLNGVME